jgi:hypothetical protein
MMFDLVMFGVIALVATVVLAVVSYRAGRQAPPLWIPPTYDPPNRLRPRSFPYDWAEEDDRALELFLRDDAEPA